MTHHESSFFVLIQRAWVRGPRPGGLGWRGYGRTDVTGASKMVYTAKIDKKKLYKQLFYSLHSIGYQPFGFAFQKGKEKGRQKFVQTKMRLKEGTKIEWQICSDLFSYYMSFPLNFRGSKKTHYRWTDRRTDRPSYRDAWTHLIRRNLNLSTGQQKSWQSFVCLRVGFRRDWRRAESRSDDRRGAVKIRDGTPMHQSPRRPRPQRLYSQHDYGLVFFAVGALKPPRSKTSLPTDSVTYIRK